MRFAAGSWIYGTLGDRYLLEGYRQGLDILVSVRMIADIDGLSGVELLYPNDFIHGLDQLGDAIADEGLDCCAVGADLAGDPKWRLGSFSSADPAVRREAVELAKEAVDAAAALGADCVNIWPGQDGHDYPFQIDYKASMGRFVEALAEVAAYRPEMKICLEYKPFEPRLRSLVATAASALLVCGEVGLPNLGVTIDSGHALQAGENISESISTLARARRLFHLHLNDNHRGFDADMALGSVHTVEFLEMVYTLRRVGYEGWLTFDVFPYREDPSLVVGESVRFIKGLDSLLDRIGMETIEDAIEGADHLRALSLIRECMLG